jgi:endoglucanase
MRTGHRLGILPLALLMGCSSGGGTASAPPTSSTPAPSPAPSPTPTPTPTSSATAITQAMSPGWNLGNSLEAIGSGAKPVASSQETVWGNPAVTQALMDAVRAAGFKSVRIPVAWNQYADGGNTISPFWLNRVAEVVTYARNSGLYAVVNIHWDGGWMQPTFAAQGAANAKLTSFWTQIANRLKDFDDHLLFAGTNEVMVTDVYTAPTAENCAVQNGFNQAFVNAVRATGGNNAGRHLVVQGYNTNIDFTIACNATMPTDTAASRLMMEVHYYDPYNFTLNTSSGIWQWGSIATIPSATETWANEAYADAQFQKMKAAFVDRGVPVILGEYAASLRTEHDPSGTYRNYWNRYVTRSAYQRGLIPIYWDNGYTTNHQSGLFNRAAATQGFPDTIGEIVNAAR